MMNMVSVCMYVRMHKCMYVYTFIHVYVYMYMYIYMYIYMFMFVDHVRPAPRDST